MYIFTEAKDRQSHIYNISKQLKMSWGYITINKTKQKQTNKQASKQEYIHSGRRWDLISSAGEQEQKWLY